MEPAPPAEQLRAVIDAPETPAGLAAALRDAMAEFDVAAADGAPPEDVAAIDLARADLAQTARLMCEAISWGEAGKGDPERAVGVVLGELALLGRRREAPLRVEPPPGSHESVRITLLWTGDPRALDLALITLREGLSAQAAKGPRGSRAERLARVDLAHQILDGALGEDRDDYDTEPHEHLGVVRWERGGPTP